MKPEIYILIAGVSALILGLLIGYFVHTSIINRRNKQLNLKADSIVSTATEKARNIELEAKDDALKMTAWSSAVKNWIAGLTRPNNVKPCSISARAPLTNAPMKLKPYTSNKCRNCSALQK
jgi:hypothetical protein